MITIEQAKNAKSELESTLAKELKKFTDQTGLKVDRIELSPILTLGGIVTYYSIDINVSL